MSQRDHVTRPWWQVTSTSKGAWGMAAGWTFCGVLGLLATTSVGWLALIPGIGFVALGLSQVAAAVILGRREPQ